MAVPDAIFAVSMVLGRLLCSEVPDSVASTLDQRCDSLLVVVFLFVLEPDIGFASSMALGTVSVGE